MMLNNKYHRWYDALMDRAAVRDLAERGEQHHVRPRGLGGNNGRTNTVRLTYREHFLAHWLLTKFTVGADRRKMLYALLMMGRRGSRSSRIIAGWQYEVSRRAASKAGIGNQYAAGRKHTAEEIAALRAYRHTDEARASMSKKHAGNKNALGSGRSHLGNKRGLGHKVSFQARARIALRQLQHQELKRLAPEGWVHAALSFGA